MTPSPTATSGSGSELIRVLLILVLAVLTVSFVIGIAAPETGAGPRQSRVSPGQQQVEWVGRVAGVMS